MFQRCERSNIQTGTRVQYERHLTLAKSRYCFNKFDQKPCHLSNVHPSLDCEQKNDAPSQQSMYMFVTEPHAFV